MAVVQDSTIHGSLNLLDLELLHHFCTVVYSTLCGEPEIQKMWQLSIPKEALRHPHLMHSVLAMSALHLSSISPQNQRHAYFNAAIQHHNTSLSGYQLLLNNVNEENGDATIANSCMLAIISAAMWNNPGNSEPQAPIEGIIEVAALTKGVHVIINAGDPFVKRGKLAPLLNPKPWDDSPTLPPDVVPALNVLRARIDSSYAPERASVYLKAIQLLHVTFEAQQVNPNHLPIALLWLVLLDRDFLDLLRDRDAMALVIFAHFGVVCQAASTLWWAKDWDSIIVKSAFEALDVNWREWIAWPMQRTAARSQGISGPGLEDSKAGIKS
jgi:hypothetical protein